MLTETAGPGQSLLIERHGDVAVITATPALEDLPEDLVEQAAEYALEPLRLDPPVNLIADLSRVTWVGSVFITFLLRCHRLTRKQGGELYVAGASAKVREELRITNLDTLWAVYDTRAEAMEALEGSD